MPIVRRDIISCEMFAYLNVRFGELENVGTATEPTYLFVILGRYQETGVMDHWNRDPK